MSPTDFAAAVGALPQWEWDDAESGFPVLRYQRPFPPGTMMLDGGRVPYVTLTPAGAHLREADITIGGDQTRDERDVGLVEAVGRVREFMGVSHA
jgi:hypothetical protein